MEHLELIRTVFSGLTFFSIIIAFISYRSNKKKEERERLIANDKELMAQSIKSMEWAYNALTEDGNNIPPLKDRLRWLTTARHICRHWKIAEQIQTATYKTIHEDHIEFWRHKFYLALDHKSLQSKNYYMDFSNPYGDPDFISIDSAIVINIFSSWEKTKTDPLDEFRDIDQSSIIVGTIGHGLECYKKAWDEHFKKISNS